MENYKIEIEDENNEVVSTNISSIDQLFENPMNNNNILMKIESGSNNEFEVNQAINNNNNNNKTTLSNKTRIRKTKNKTSNAQKVDAKAKLERSRQSARECRARKKLRYQYLEDLVAKRENANNLLKKEFEQLKNVVSMLTSDQCNLDEVKKCYKSII